MKRRIVGIALFCLVLLAAILAGYWDMLSTERMRIASEEAASGTAAVTGDAQTGPSSNDTAKSAPTAASTSMETPSREADVSPSDVPTFDILRVEPDGSTVMAGKAAVGATVRLTDGAARVLGEEKVGPGGDFAIVLDTPLSVGEHQIRIEATKPDGAAAVSRETAIVSVPERGRESELLAMVEAPDQPSRLISVPQGEPSSVPSPEMAAAPAASVSTGTDGPNAAPQPAASGEVAAVSESGTASPSSPERPAGSAGVTAAGTSTSGTTGSANLVAPSTLAVEAVEIEDDTIYVAGRAPAGPTIRIYVDNIFLAEDAKRSTERFLVSATSRVRPGEHVVRADQVAPDGSVLARVEVPFVKPEGRTMSAIAGAGASVASSEAPASGPAGAASSDAASSVSSSRSASVNQGEVVPLPATGEAAKTGSSTDDGRSSTTSIATASDLAPNGTQLPSSGTGQLAGPNTAVPSVAGETLPEPASAPSEGGSTTGLAETEPSSIAAERQAPLEAAGARVIIRRGDTLWRISREAYGRGARYTTIYLANGDQIRDPNRIYPGQVFRMPEGAAR